METVVILKIGVVTSNCAFGKLVLKEALLSMSIQSWEQASQENCEVPIPGGILEMCGCVTEGQGLVMALSRAC